MAFWWVSKILAEISLKSDTSAGDLSSNEVLFEQDKPVVANSDVSSPLTERTDRLLSTNQSFNLVKHRPLD